MKKQYITPACDVSIVTMQPLLVNGSGGEDGPSLGDGGDNDPTNPEDPDVRE